MDTLDLFGHAGYILLLVGQLLITKKRKIGFLIRLVGELGWGVIGLALGMSSIVIWSLVFAVVEVVGWVRWRREWYKE